MLLTNEPYYKVLPCFLYQEGGKMLTTIFCFKLFIASLGYNNITN